MDFTQYEGHHPGPWRWIGDTKEQTIHLATNHSGQIYVMGFERWGMRSAQPSFQPDHEQVRGIIKASELVVYEVGDRSIRGHKAAMAHTGPEWVYRKTIADIDCPDGRLLRDAPLLLARVIELERENASLRRAVSSEGARAGKAEMESIRLIGWD